ncbi:hypothetical protein [Streptomyces sp. NBRC 109706]|uniref:hypothetical protein n=1 Tax=Streptomyces sp. NBRC 109706 TaxID=1550035 RepID=UPI000782E7DF|nr:hypothetical protein [Streptomyces sp. NBRC 109706]
MSHIGPDRILSGPTENGEAPYVELGVWAATVLHQRDALTPTASLWRTDQGPPQRLDRMYCTRDLVSALLRLWVDDSSEVVACSDHALVLAEFDLERLRYALA